MEELYAYGGFVFKAFVDKTYEYDLHIVINSDTFIGTGYFSFYPELLSYTINGLEKIYLELCGIFIMKDDESNYYISFEIQENGSIIVSGKIGDFSGNSIEFINHADQTLIGNLIKLLKK